MVATARKPASKASSEVREERKGSWGNAGWGTKDTHLIRFHQHKSQARQSSSKKPRRKPDGGMQPEKEEEKEEEIIRLGPDAAPVPPPLPPPLPPQQRKLVQAASRMANMRLETGLPTPSYFRFEKVGKVQKATLDPRATPVVAQVQAALLSKTAATQKHPGAAGERTTTSVHERDRERDQDAKMLIDRKSVV